MRKDLLIVIILVVILLFGLSYFAINFSQQTPEESTVSTQDQSSTPSGTNFPVAPDHPNVSSTSIIYTFSGIADAVSENSLQIESSGPALPAFTINDNTEITFFENENKRRANLTDIQKGDSVAVTARFDAQNSQWIVTHVTKLGSQVNSSVTPPTR
jgi:hypothetical protein